MKRFIKQNQQEIETFPAKVESELVGVTDAADVSVKFRSKRCSGYAMDFYPEAAPIFAMVAKIAAIFRKHGRPIKELGPDIDEEDADAPTNTIKNARCGRLDLEWDVDPDEADPRRVDVV